MEKPVFEVDISINAGSSLEAHKLLTAGENEDFFHISNNLRLPLGIYNISVSRVCDKLVRLCEFLEDYIRKGVSISSLTQYESLMKGVIDYLELAVYASAEHIDDIYSIAHGYFKTKGKAKKDTSFRKLDKEIKLYKKLISTVANEIKHKQSRVRMFTMEYEHHNNLGCLHGYFIEGVEGGVICPSKIVHRSQDVFSITTITWEMIYLLLNCSRSLAEFLEAILPNNRVNTNTSFDSFSNAVIAAARLPIYTFGEEHPFSRATLKIKASNNNYQSIDSGLYGSIKNQWSRTSSVKFGSHTSRFEGDGVSRSFRYAEPKSVSLHHWD